MGEDMGAGHLDVACGRGGDGDESFFGQRGQRRMTVGGVVLATTPSAGDHLFATRLTRLADRPVAAARR
ncbi:hypothetical protein AB0N88_37640 [Streptomyces sp. NPDC093516]|uniref:hypothetical protein n=1 Tax=Streptomyces sp. NPDC093516 TaxID=3155304 RepID=UPI0034325914